MTHAPFAPSAFKRKALCPGSHQGELGYPDKTSAAAIDGTHTHTLIERCLNSNLSAESYVGEKMTDHEGEFIVDEARAARADYCVEYVDALLDTLDDSAVLGVEVEVNPGKLIGRQDWYGTADVTIVDHVSRQAHVIDHKDGSMPVSAYQNLQGVSYMLGLGETLDDPMEYTYTFHITQPRIPRTDSWEVSGHKLSWRWLEAMGSIIDACEAEDPEFIPGEEQCQFCLHRIDCYSRRKMALEAASNILGGSMLPAATLVSEEPVAPGRMLPPVDKLETVQLGELWKAAPILKGFLKDVDNELMARYEAGGYAKGIKLVQGEGNRKWNPDMPEESIIRALCRVQVNKQKIFTTDDVREKRLVSFTKVLGHPKLDKAKKQELEAKFLVRPKSKPKLVLDTEPGEDISPAAVIGKYAPHSNPELDPVNIDNRAPREHRTLEHAPVHQSEGAVDFLEPQIEIDFL